MEELNVQKAIYNLLNGKLFIIIDKHNYMHLVCSYRYYDKIKDELWKDSDEETVLLYANRCVRKPYDVILKELPITKFGNIPSNKTLNRPLYDDRCGRGFEGSLLYLCKKANISSIVTVFDVIRNTNNKICAQRFNPDVDVYYDYIYENDINRECMLNNISKDPVAIINDQHICVNCKNVIIEKNEDFSYTFFCGCESVLQNKIKEPFTDNCKEFLGKWVVE